ncbi:MAG: hypothetical protein VW016_03765, partial [Luminiphilus sp.]
MYRVTKFLFSQGMARAFAVCGVVVLLTLGSSSGRAVTDGLKIPNLGESSTSLFSADYEYNLGQWWLKAFRRQAPTLNDPLVYSYLESLVFELVT